MTDVLGIIGGGVVHQFVLRLLNVLTFSFFPLVEDELFLEDEIHALVLGEREREKFLIFESEKIWKFL